MESRIHWGATMSPQFDWRLLAEQRRGTDSRQLALTPAPESFAAKVRRLHRQGLRSTNIATMLQVELSEVAAALSEGAAV